MGEALITRRGGSVGSEITYVSNRVGNGNPAGQTIVPDYDKYDYIVLYKYSRNMNDHYEAYITGPGEIFNLTTGAALTSNYIVANSTSVGTSYNFTPMDYVYTDIIQVTKGSVFKPRA